MGLIRRTAHALLGALFIISGVDVYGSPEPRAATAGPFFDRLASVMPLGPEERVLAVKANAGIQVVAGTALAVGVAPRLASLALAASIVPTTLGGHRFWEMEGPAVAQQRTQFLKNAAILGGLLLAASPGGRGQD